MQHLTNMALMVCDAEPGFAGDAGTLFGKPAAECFDEWLCAFLAGDRRSSGERPRMSASIR